MAVSYTCPNPECGVTLKTPNRVPAGKSVKCPKCNQPFVPEVETEAPPPAPEAGALKFADEPETKKKPAKPGAKPVAKQEPPKKEEGKPPPAGHAKPLDDDEEDDESIKRGYGVVKETEEEIAEAEKHKPTFTEVQDKFKKSARGPAQALLVMPSNLLAFEGLITVAGGMIMFVIGMWPLVFNDAPPGDEETEEAIQQMVVGMAWFLWGALICYGASQMQELASYTWAMVGAVAGILPLLVGIFGIVMLQNPKVKAGFEEGDSGPDEEEEEDDDDDDDDDDEEEDDDDDDDDDDDEDDDDEEDRARKKKGRKAKRNDDDDGRINVNARSKDDDEDEDRKRKKGRKAMRDDDDDEEDARPRKKQKIRDD